MSKNWHNSKEKECMSETGRRKKKDIYEGVNCNPTVHREQKRTWEKQNRKGERLEEAIEKPQVKNGPRVEKGAFSRPRGKIRWVIQNESCSNRRKYNRGRKRDREWQRTKPVGNASTFRNEKKTRKKNSIRRKKGPQEIGGRPGRKSVGGKKINGATRVNLLEKDKEKAPSIESATVTWEKAVGAKREGKPGGREEKSQKGLIKTDQELVCGLKPGLSNRRGGTTKKSLLPNREQWEKGQQTCL